MKMKIVLMATFLTVIMDLFQVFQAYADDSKKCSFYFRNSDPASYYQHELFNHTKFLEQIKTALAAKGYNLTSKKVTPENWLVDIEGNPAVLIMDMGLGDNNYTRQPAKGMTLISTFFEMLSYYKATPDTVISPENVDLKDVNFDVGPTSRRSLFASSVDLSMEDFRNSNYENGLASLLAQMPTCNQVKSQLISMDKSRPIYRYFTGIVKADFSDNFPLVSQAKCLLAQKRAIKAASDAGMTKDQCQVEDRGVIEFGDPIFSNCYYDNTGSDGYYVPRKEVIAEVRCDINNLTNSK